MTGQNPESEDRLRARLAKIQRLARVGSWEWSSDTGEVLWSEELWHLLGREPGSGPPHLRTFLDCLVPADRPAFKRSFLHFWRTSEPLRVELRVLTPSGEERRLGGEAVVDRDDRGAVVRHVGIFQDVTELRAVEARLRESERRFRGLSEASFEGLVIHDQGTIRDVNRTMADLFGYTQEELIGTPILDYIAPDFRDAVTEAVRLGRTQPYELIGLRKDRSTFPIEAIGKPLPLDGRDLRVAAVRDLSERKRVEEQARRAQKLESVGQLAGGIAHDFNNLLQVILGYGSLARARAEHGEPSPDELEQMLAAAERAAELTRQLMAFGRQQPGDPVPLDLNKQTEGLLRLLRRILPEHIAVEFEPGEDVVTVHFDPVQLEQVLMNLCVNARDAMPNGGKLEIETKTVTLGEDALQAHPWAGPGRYALLAVSDTGEGMTAEVRERIFEPFFTTKEQGKGTGLGLAMVYGIVEQAGGLIHVVSEAGRGARFEILLPASELSPTEASSSSAAQPPRGSETVLLAEDEEMVRRLVTQVMEDAGYRVIEAHDGNEAVRLFEEHLGEIDLVVLDAVMPGLGGADVYGRIHELSESAKVLFTSGYSSGSLPRSLLRDRGLVLLKKPYDPVDLLRAVRQVLDTP